MDPAELRTVLVTGGAGYIGSHTCKLLAQAGIRPVAFDNLGSGHRWAVRWGPLIEGDLSHVDEISDVIRRHDIDSVIHFAASISVGESVREPLAYYRNNLVGTLNLLEAMRNGNVKRLIFSSSAAIYGTPEEVPIPETHRYAPVSPYGQTKLDCENAIRWVGAAHGIRSICLRYFNASGADASAEIGEAHEPETHLIPLAILAAMGRHPELAVFGADYPTPDGTAIRDYIHVSDLAQAHIRGLEVLAAGAPSCAVNVGTGRGHSVMEVIRSVEKASGRPVPHRIAPRREGDPAALIADARKAREVLDWRPSVESLDEIVLTAWEWHRRHHGQV